MNVLIIIKIRHKIYIYFFKLTFNKLKVFHLWKNTTPIKKSNTISTEFNT